jgi:hypothetical protein
VVSFSDLFAAGLAALLLSLGIVFVIDLAAVAFGDRFGRSSGWLALVLPCWLFVEEFRAWRGVPGRVGVAALAALVALPMGLSAAFAVNYLPALLSGGVGAAVTILAYLTMWFFGIRWLARRTGDRG